MTKNLSANVALVCYSIFVCAVLLELILRLAFPIYMSAADTHYERDELRIWSPKAHRHFEKRHPDTGLPHQVIYNNLGLRQSRDFNDLESGENIAFFGDSFTENKRLPSAYSFNEPLDYLLKAHGHFNVLNFGVDGYGTDQSYLHYSAFENKEQLDYVFYVLCANDIRNIYESNLFALGASGELVKNELPEPAWWISLVSRLHLTYLGLDLRQRLLKGRSGGLHYYREALEQAAMKASHEERYHSPQADALEESLLSAAANENLTVAMRIFKKLLRQWRREVEANGGRFYVVLLPREEEAQFVEILEGEHDIVDLGAAFDEAVEHYDWDALTFENDGHWAEEGNRLAALELYRFLEDEMNLTVPPDAEPQVALETYYAAFDYGWRPLPTTQVAKRVDEGPLSVIRQRYSGLEAGYSVAREAGVGARTGEEQVSTRTGDNVGLNEYH